MGVGINQARGRRARAEGVAEADRAGACALSRSYIYRTWTTYSTLFAELRMWRILITSRSIPGPHSEYGDLFLENATADIYTPGQGHSTRKRTEASREELERPKWGSLPSPLEAPGFHTGPAGQYNIHIPPWGWWFVYRGMDLRQLHENLPTLVR